MTYRSRVAPIWQVREGWISENAGEGERSKGDGALFFSSRAGPPCSRLISTCTAALTLPFQFLLSLALSCAALFEHVGVNTASALRALLKEKVASRQPRGGTDNPPGALSSIESDSSALLLHVSVLTAPGVTFVGETSAGLPHGRGAQLFTFPSRSLSPPPSDATFARVYVGEFSRGKRHGRGKMVTWEGEVHEGEWCDDGPGGEGAFLFKRAERGQGSDSGDGQAAKNDVNEAEQEEGEKEQAAPASSSFSPVAPLQPRRRLRGFVGAFAGGPRGPGVLTFVDGGNVAGTFQGLRLEAPDEAEGQAAKRRGETGAASARAVAEETLAGILAAEPELAAGISRMPEWAERAA